MQIPPVPQDDLLDVMEMTHKLEKYISRVTKGHDVNLGMSALMSACINCTLAQCKTLNEVMTYRNIFVQIFENSIRSIKIKENKN